MQVEGTHYILTAAHVWYETKYAEKIGLGLTANPSGFTMSRDAVCAKVLWNGVVSEWGPDLALLQLAPSDVSTIAACKSFLNLTQQKATFTVQPPDMEKGFWAVTGMVGKFSDVQTCQQTRTIRANIVERAMFSVIGQTLQLDGYDYLDLGVKSDLIWRSLKLWWR